MPKLGAPPITEPPTAGTEVIDANDLVRNALEIWNRRGAFPDVELATALQPDVGAVEVNRRWIVRAIRILIDNAVHWIAGCPERRVTILTRRRGRMVEIECADTGCGFAPDVLERVRRREQVTTRSGKGIGLQNVAKLALVYGGNLEVSNREDGGTGAIVRISLPVAVRAAFADMGAENGR